MWQLAVRAPFALTALAMKCPRSAVLNLHRLLVISELVRDSAGLLATFGVSDEALFGMLTGNFAPTGRLPFELPLSMEAVRNQLEDLPHDSKDPLFPFGHGLTYPGSRNNQEHLFLHRAHRLSRSRFTPPGGRGHAGSLRWVAPHIEMEILAAILQVRPRFTDTEAAVRQCEPPPSGTGNPGKTGAMIWHRISVSRAQGVCCSFPHSAHSVQQEDPTPNIR